MLGGEALYRQGVRSRIRRAYGIQAQAQLRRGSQGLGKGMIRREGPSRNRLPIELQKLQNQT